MPVVALEAFDGVGKTTAAERLAELWHGIRVTSLQVADKDRPLRQKLNLGQDVDARFAYFLDLNRWQITLARAISAAGRLATLDSTVYRTVATHRVLGSQAAIDCKIEEDLLPDTTVYLRLAEPIRIARLTQRDGSLVHPSHWDATLYEKQAELAEAYGSFGLSGVEADQDVESIVAKVAELAQLPPRPL